MEVGQKTGDAQQGHTSRFASAFKTVARRTYEYVRKPVNIAAVAISAVIDVNAVKFVIEEVPKYIQHIPDRMGPTLSGILGYDGMIMGVVIGVNALILGRTPKWQFTALAAGVITVVEGGILAIGAAVPPPLQIPVAAAGTALLLAYAEPALIDGRQYVEETFSKSKRE